MNKEIKRASVYCCQCKALVKAQLTTGKEIYPGRKDLSHLPFWVCPTCRCYVGCAKAGPNAGKPMGCIPTPALRQLRSQIHRILDPLWQDLRGVSRGSIYLRMTAKLKYNFHAADLRTVYEAKEALTAAKEVEKEVLDSL